MNAAMRERPILFKAPMVRAILDGMKTQTRRMAKHPLAVAAKRIHSCHGMTEFDCILSDDSGGIIHCPYGQPGDLLWVRETFNSDWCEKTIYHADTMAGAIDAGYETEVKWRPSIFMPRSLSRITLEITGVRVERLQNISDADSLQEGISLDLSGEVPICSVEGEHQHYLRQGSFALLWESINGSGSWGANPWVWIVEFRRVRP